MARHEDLTIEAYHKTPAVGASMLGTFLDSGPTIYHAQHIAKTLPAPTGKHFRIGDAVHCAIEGREAITTIPAEALSRNGQRRGKAWDQFVADNSNHLLLTSAEAKQVKAIVDAILTNRMARRLLEAADVNEKSIFWEDENLGGERKCRPDILVPGIIVDVKTTRLIRPDAKAFGKSAYDFGYHRQASTYQTGVAEFTGDRNWQSVYIVASTTPPYLSYIHRWGDDAIMLGERQNNRALTDLRKHYSADTWVDPQQAELSELQLPPWAWRDEEERQ